MLLNPSTALNYNLTPGSSGYMSVTGGLNLSFATPNSVTVNISGNNVTAGTYQLIGYNSLNPGTAGITAFAIGSTPSSVARDTFSFSTSANVLNLVITAGAPASSPSIWQTGSGSWSTAGNWVGNQAPGGHSGDTAVFGTVATSGGTVALDSSQSVASLGFSNSGGASFTIVPAGTSTLTLANTSGTATISNSGGSHTITTRDRLGRQREQLERQRLNRQRVDHRRVAHGDQSRTPR